MNKWLIELMLFVYRQYVLYTRRLSPEFEYPWIKTKTFLFYLISLIPFDDFYPFNKDVYKMIFDFKPFPSIVELRS